MVGREGIGGIGACLGAVEWRIVELQIPSTLLASMAEECVIYKFTFVFNGHLPIWMEAERKQQD